MQAALLRSTLPVTETFQAEYLEYYGLLPIAIEGGRLRVATSGTPTEEVLEDLARTFGASPELVEAERAEIVDSIRALYSSVESTDALVRAMDLDQVLGSDADRSNELEADARDLANQPPVIRYVNLLVREAHAAAASDIHVEATAGGAVVRFRIDGVLTGATAPPRSMQAAVVSRLKLIADLDIAERRVPQDGRIRLRLDEQDLDLRVSTVPTLHGESIVLRLLDQGAAPGGLRDLGMADDVLDAFREVATLPHGIVLATGPTGSGKTTTLYSALQLRDAEREKIITIEDPVEYRLSRVTQVPVNTKAGMTFAAGLRALLRQDPDVVMVGEMRDSETATIAVRAAMTGHLVFSTVHTNDSASAVTRLVDLGVEPYLVAATLQGVLAQRLVRRICSSCAQQADRDAAFDQLMRATGADLRPKRGVGCALCHQTGYRGRVGLFEFMRVTDELRRQIAMTPEADRVRAVAEDEGMRAMAEDGRAKVLKGVTTAREVLRAVQS